MLKYIKKCSKKKTNYTNIHIITSHIPFFLPHFYVPIFFFWTFFYILHLYWTHFVYYFLGITKPKHIVKKIFWLLYLICYYIHVPQRTTLLLFNLYKYGWRNAKNICWQDARICIFSINCMKSFRICKKYLPWFNKWNGAI